MPNTNPLGQPIGSSLPAWQGATEPNRETLHGSRCRVEALDANRHAQDLFEAFREDESGRNWTYLPYGPFESASDYAGFVDGIQRTNPDTHFFAIVDLDSDLPVGVASYLRAVPSMGSIEVGHLCYSPRLQRTPLSTEAMYLMMRRVFDDWGYRRYEWKCHSLNGPSVAAAKRLGFRYEGLFRNHVVFKGRNRDTSWLSITDEEWPGIREAMETWLRPENFDAGGRQRQALSATMPPTSGQPIVVEAECDSS